MLLDAVLDFHQRVAIERLLASARLVTALIIFVSLVSNVGVLHQAAGKLVTGAYAVFALAVLIAARHWPQAVLAAPDRLHALDFAWATLATSVSGGPSSHAFPLFAFVLITAAYRWGMRRTVFDAGLIVVIAVVQSALALSGATPWPFEFDWFVLWGAYIVVLAMLFGGLSERMHALSFQAIALGQVLSYVGQATGVASAIRYTLREILRLFGGREVFLVAHEADTDRVFIWRAAAQPFGPVVVSNEELPPSDRASWVFPLPGSVGAFEARRSGEGGDAAATLSLGTGGEVLDASFSFSPSGDGHSWRTLIAAVIELRNEWGGRLYVTDPGMKPGGPLRLGFLQNLLQQIAPVLLELYLLRGLRARAESRERARISRELHDGIIQSLVGLEMRLDVTRRQAEALAPELAGDLSEVRDLLNEEALRARELMERLRPVEVDAERLPRELEDLLERFSRNTGIGGRLEWTLRALDLTPRECREISRVVQEALVNVRRHSGASKVTVRVESDADGWRLIVVDNGRGLGFLGRLNDGELRARSAGPRVIQDRVAALGGSLAAESSSQGTRLEMTFPRTEPD